MILIIEYRYRFVCCSKTVRIRLGLQKLDHLLQRCEARRIIHRHQRKQLKI